MSDKFSADDVVTLYSIFTGKRWNNNLNHEQVFAAFCELLGNLDADQRRLILELTERYLWITSKEYEEMIFEVLDKVEIEKLQHCKRIVFIPIVRPEDDGKIKSSTSILYLLKGFGTVYRGKFEKIKFDVLDKLSDAKSEEFKIEANDLIFMVDDFLGSGETVKAALEVVLANRNIQSNAINIMGIIAQSDAVNFLKSIEIPFYVKEIRGKAISEFYSSPQLERYTQIMKSIEEMIQGNHFQFGYEGSEALVTMIRTPDNTFPIFWKDYKKNNKKFTGPFNRYKQ